MQYFYCLIINILDCFSESFLDLSSASSSDSYWQYFNELLYSGTGYPASNV